MKRFIYVVGTVLSFTLVSCEKDNNVVVPSATLTSQDFSVQEKNGLIEDFSKILASAVGDVELRKLVKEEAQYRFDGDYNILSQKLMIRELAAKQMRVQDFLAAQNTSATLKSVRKSTKVGNTAENNSIEELVEMIQKAIPNLQVSVPVHCDEWDAEEYVPLVAFLPFDYDERTATEITAYDSEGNEHVLSLLEDPDMPVIVVSRSERIDENGNSIIGTGESFFDPNDLTAIATRAIPSAPSNISLSHGIARQLMLEWNDVSGETGYEVHRQTETEAWRKVADLGTNNNNYFDNNLTAGKKYWYRIRSKNAEGNSAWSPIYATTASERRDTEWLKINKMKFSTSALKAAEKWASGAPELRLRVVTGSATGQASCVYTSGVLEASRRKDIENKWWNKTVQILTWDTNHYGTVLTFEWREEDWEDNVTFSINASYENKLAGGEILFGGKVDIPTNKGGYKIGTMQVLWWHPKNQNYDLTGFEWTFAQ